jgi:hypothetical protein
MAVENGFTPEEVELALQAILSIELIAEANESGKDDDWGKVFRMCHAARNPSCMPSHPKWKKEITDTYEKFKGQ